MENKFTEEDKRIMDMVDGKKDIIVVNKIDLPNKLNLRGIEERLNGKKMVEISAEKRVKLDKLEQAISDMVWDGQVLSSHESLITNVRHANALSRTHKSIQKAKNSVKKGFSAEFIAVDVKEAMDALGEIVGETVVEDILDRIFGEFCIGK